MHYNLGKVNVVEYGLSILYMGSLAHVEEDRKELRMDVHRLARFGVRLYEHIYKCCNSSE